MVELNCRQKASGPHDSLCQWKSCQLLRLLSCIEKVVQEIEVMELTVDRRLMNMCVQRRRFDRRINRRQSRVLLTTRSLAVAKFSTPENCVPGYSSVFYRYPNFHNTVWDRWKEAPLPRTSSIRPVVSIQNRLVTEGRADRHTTVA